MYAERVTTPMFTIIQIATFSLPCQDTACRRIWPLLADLLS